MTTHLNAKKIIYFMTTLPKDHYKPNPDGIYFLVIPHADYISCITELQSGGIYNWYNTTKIIMNADGKIIEVDTQREVKDIDEINKIKNMTKIMFGQRRYSYCYYNSYYTYYYYYNHLLTT
jgi:hypothetical protein